MGVWSVFTIIQPYNEIYRLPYKLVYIEIDWV